LSQGNDVHAIRIDEKLITIQDSSAFAGFVNDLIRGEARRAGISQAQIDTTLRVTARDEGIDGHVTADMGHASEWIPACRRTWQYKAGSCPSATKLTESELRKPGVVAVIEAGEPYCFVTADDITAPQTARLLEAINRE
jgi:hypothetical protein